MNREVITGARHARLMMSMGSVRERVGQHTEMPCRHRHLYEPIGRSDSGTKKGSDSERIGNEEPAGAVMQ